MLTEGLVELGFRPYLDPEHQSTVITTFHYHEDPGFYQRLADRGFVLYPGKLSKADCFRVGTVGQLGVEEVLALLVATRMTLEQMGVDLAPKVSAPE